MDPITLTCPTCGVILRVQPDRQEFSCWFCGSEYRLKEKDMDTTLTQMALHQVEGEISGLVTSKERKLDELARCINAIIRQPEHALDALLAQRNRLEDDILELSLIIHLKRAELNRTRRMDSSPNPGD